MVFTATEALQPDDPQELPCGQCAGCLLERSRQWALRCVHESLMHEENLFLTLTYNDETLKSRDNPWTLVKKDFQDFMKRLRKKYVPKNPHPEYLTDNPHPKLIPNFNDVLVINPKWQLWNKRNKNPLWKYHAKNHNIRFFMCGEYGEYCKDCLQSRKMCEKNHYGIIPDSEWDKIKVPGRPHFHCILFNHSFDDTELDSITPTGEILYKSETLNKLWRHGNCSFGEVTFQSAAYVARYCLKKITGDMAEDHYTRVIPDTGEIYPLLPEFTQMSTKPAIAEWFLEEYIDDIYPKDYVTQNGKKMRPPKYYDRYLDLVDPYLLEYLKDMRKLDAAKHLDDNTPERLQVRETVLNKKLLKLIRPLDA